MNRGYSLDRGRGIKRRGQARPACPKCGKRGMGPPVTVVFVGVLYTTKRCRYCQHTERV